MIYATMAILIASTTWAQDKKEELKETYEAFAVFVKELLDQTPG